MKNVESTHAELIVANNPGCIAQMKYGLDLFGCTGEIIHLATLLNRAYASHD
jgi:Fe-S oxidoreductase